MSRRAPRRLTLAATGAGGGAVAGLLGGGGGAVMIPLMTGLLKMNQHTAHGTSLVIIVFAALASALTYTLNAAVDWPLTATLIGGSTVGAYLGARGAGRLNAMRLRQCLGLFLLGICGRLLLFRDLAPAFQGGGAPEILVGVGIGLAGGLAAGALGVGGGAIFVPAMVLLLGTDQHEAQGISLWVVVAAALAGSATHRRHGTVDMAAARWIIPLAVPAGAGASYLATRMSDDTLQTTFAILLSLIGIQMIATATLRLRNERPGRLPAFEAEVA
jgi:uncharacterized protein